MDGNASWAAANGRGQLDGYLRGMRNLIKIALLCKKFGMKYATFYAFSTENWQRPQKWIIEFMNLAMSFYETDPSINDLKKEGAKLILLGDLARLDSKMQRTLRNLEEETKFNTGINVCLAISYGGRDEIVRACRKIVDRGDVITEERITMNLDTSGVPDPDIIVRSSGKCRLSNFLLWQSSYSELYFADVFWPDFAESDLEKAIAEFKVRKRTYGK
jgi:undecaprenyl diphosphate synthase